MNGALLVLTWLTPLLAAALAWRAWGRWLPALMTLPALAAAMILPIGARLDVPWLLLGARFGLDGNGRIFLLFTAVLWLVAGLQAALTMGTDLRAGRFRLFFLLAMAGNLLLIVGQDLASFYLGFSLMGLAAYGLVIHSGEPAALRAGRGSRVRLHRHQTRRQAGREDRARRARRDGEGALPLDFSFFSPF